MNKLKKALMVVISFALAVTLVVCIPVYTGAAKKPSLTKSIMLEKGNATELKVKNISEKTKVKWSSDNKAVATVSGKGKVTAKSMGIAEITAEISGKKYTCTVKVIQKMFLTKKIQIETGDSTKLILKNAPKDVRVKWSCDDVVIADVSSDGTVTAKMEGTARVTASVSRIKYTCKVNVVKKSLGSYDGDIYYTTPADYRTKRTDVTYGEVKTMQYYSTTTEKERRLKVVLPPGYTEEKKYPVMYLLHGLGQDDTDWLNANAPVIIGNMIHAGTAKEMILVLPNCRARANDAAGPADVFALSNYQAFDNFINDLRDNVMPFIKENFSIMEGRENTAIGGFSMGGRTALYIGMSMQESFGYIGGGCPAPGIFAYTGNGVTEPGLFTQETFCLKPEYAENTLVLIVAGKSDNMVGNYPESYHNALEANHSRHIWYKYSGGHDLNVMDNFLYNFATRAFTDNIQPAK
ncbi:MAG: hypothetical protein HFH68_11095 [Lachnospiraceae bacterium]|nr:hypothetical protein [Lachnospiraceae bacterium]